MVLNPICFVVNSLAMGDVIALVPSIKWAVENIYTDKNYIFSGVTAYHPAFFQYASTGRYSVTPLMRQFADRNHVTGELYQGIWFDIGSLEQLSLAEKSIA